MELESEASWNAASQEAGQRRALHRSLRTLDPAGSKAIFPLLSRRWSQLVEGGQRCTCRGEPCRFLNHIPGRTLLARDPRWWGLQGLGKASHCLIWKDGPLTDGQTRQKIADERAHMPSNENFPQIRTTKSKHIMNYWEIHTEMTMRTTYQAIMSRPISLDIFHLKPTMEAMTMRSMRGIVTQSQAIPIEDTLTLGT